MTFHKTFRIRQSPTLRSIVGNSGNTNHILVRYWCAIYDIQLSKASWKERKLFLTRFTAARLFTTTHVVSETSIDIPGTYDIYNVKRESSSLIYGITQCSRLFVRRDGFHRENDVTATDTSFPWAAININAICCKNTTDCIIHNIHY